MNGLSSRTAASLNQTEIKTMKARALAEALDGRVTGDAEVEITRAAHPTEIVSESDIAVAISPDTVRLLGACRARTVLALEGTELPPRQFQTVIFLRRSRSNLPAITQIFRHRPSIDLGIHPTAVIAPGAVIAEDVMIGPLVVIGPGATVGPRSAILSQATVE